MAEVTVALPVYNGAKTLRRALDQIAAQTFTDYVFAISDNASTDETAAICIEYAGRDPRIVYKRRETLVAPSENFRGLLSDATTEFFMWISDDDIWHPTFIAKCLGLLRRDPGVVCALPKSMHIALDGTRTMDKGTYPLRGTPARRLRDFLRSVDGNHHLYGLFRTAALRQSFPTGDWLFGYDWLVVALTTLAGEHDEVPEVLFEKFLNPAHHYFSYYSFEVHNIFERVFPSLLWTMELRRRVPADVWRAARVPLIAINLDHAAQRLEYYHPWTRPVLRNSRGLMKRLRGKAPPLAPML